MDNIVVFGDHNIGYELVNYLLNNLGKDDYQIIVIYTNNNPSSWWKKIIDLKDKYKIKICIYNEFETPIDLLKEEIDYLLLLSWKHIIPITLINHVKKHVLNLHYSLLPKHRGVYPVNWAIQEGDVETGVTFHLVNEKIDQGKIIGQKKTIIQINDNSKTLLFKLDKLAIELFKEIWANRKCWDILSKEQNGDFSYHSHKDSSRSNLLSLQKEYKLKELLNLLKAKSFGDYTNAYFIDESSNKKYSINIQISEIDLNDPI